ncbi:transposase [Polaromonas sp. CG_23.6]|uniref:transposase n=1 Tax=Polaromonas sp. CG_23.6 TaxID=2760709 RepID=UPI002474AEBC|nr:transposase [Polaromonas sp. CG_23.6]MDH6186786.1 transposase-like protein [Polaromonas sp. CG_23.6]
MPRKPHSHHSPEFKEQALLKARHRGAHSLLSLASELNMSPGTLKRWVLDSGKAAGQARGEPSLALDGLAMAWSPLQRLTALQESYGLSDAALGAWCRERGVFEHQLTQWRENFCTPITPASREASGAFRELQRQHDQLQRELRRNEKALAEVAALLVLQKNLPRRCWRARTNDVRPAAPKVAWPD